MAGWSRRGLSLLAVGLALGTLPLIVADPAVAATPTTATLSVTKGGDRTGAQTVGDLAGATFDFFAGVSGTRPGPGDVPAASCVTSVAGVCSVDVPGRTGTNQGYWIIERSAPSGYTVIQTMDTGGSTTTPTIYNGIFTGIVRNNQSYDFPVVTTGNTNRTARGSQWADARVNPSFPTKCGLDIALLIDVSGSISSSLPAVKAAANGFVDALTGTPSTIALYAFSSDAHTVLNPTPVSDTAGADTVKAAINSLAAGGGTNWDAGLHEVAVAPSHFDTLVMLTDGNPTLYGPPPAQGPGNFTRFTEVENGVFSANEVKALDTKVVAVGVGSGVTGSAENLQAISGPVRGEDFVQTDYAELAEVFRALALRSCAGTISVVKKVIPPGGSAADAVPDGGWTMTTSTVDVTPVSAVTADGTGAVNFDAGLHGRPSRSVTIAETLKPGFALVEQAGFNAACAADGTSVPVIDSGPLGFTVDATATAIVSCVVLNQAPDRLASVVVDKHWVINGDEFDDPDQPTQFQSDLQLTGLTDPSWGVPYQGFTAGQPVTVGEALEVAQLPPGCSNVASGDIGEHMLVAGPNTFTVTNTVSCVTRLRLLKTVDNPYGSAAAADAWTLSAFAPDAPDPVITGTTGVIGEVTPDVPYAMTETTVAGYAQTVAEGAVIVSPATGSWRCSVLLHSNMAGKTAFDGTNGLVEVELGQTAQCTATNQAQAAKLTLRKTVHNRFGGTAVSADWVLNAVPLPTGAPVATPISGRDGEPSVTGAAQIPGVPYHLSETQGPSGYQEVDHVACVLTGTDAVVPTPDQVLVATIGQDITCTFANEDIEPRLTLVKHVVDGSARPTEWNLTATPSEGTIVTGASGSPPVTNALVRAGVGYTLSESDGPTAYEEASGPTCVLTGTTTAAPVVNRVVVPAAGQDITCTFQDRLKVLPVTGVKLAGLVGTGGTVVLLGIAMLILARPRPRS